MRKLFQVDDFRKDIKIVLLICIINFRAIESTLYDFGPVVNDISVDYSSWTSGSQKIDFLTSVPLLGGGVINNAWVNSYGSISLNETTENNINTILYNVVLAPFFSVSQEGTQGTVYYRQSVKPGALFDAISRDISAFDLDSESVFVPTYVLLVTWSAVSSPDDASKANSFQLALTTDSSKTYVIFTYNPFDWTSSFGNFGAAGIRSSRGPMEFCSHFLEGSESAGVYQLAMTSNIIGSKGIHVIDITNPLDCTSGFSTACGTFPPPGRWVYRPKFELVNELDVDMNYYLDFICKPGFFIRRNVTMQKINCRYESDYYNFEWDEEVPTCVDLDATRRFITTIEVSEINNEGIPTEMEGLKEITDKAISRLLETVGVNNVVNAIDKIRNGTAPTSAPNTSKNSSIVVEFTTYIPPFTNKKLTNSSLQQMLTNEIGNNSVVDLVHFMKTTVSVTDMTTSCLQECLCRNMKDPILCRRGNLKPDLIPDACCGECGGKMIAYASSIKACCGNRKLYDPNKKVCCDGYIKNGHECPA